MAQPQPQQPARMPDPKPAPPQPTPQEDVRTDIVRAFQAAFDEWDRRAAQAHPEFGGPKTERGEYFAKLLDELAAGGPWASIGA